MKTSYLLSLVLTAELLLAPFVATLHGASPGGVEKVAGKITPHLPDPGNTGVPKQQQEQIGLQAVSEVYQQMPVLPDSSPEAQYVQRLGKKLVTVIPQQYSWPYQFHVIAQKEINAFAVPGGPIFVNIGTITAAENEAQLAGVMAHEASHIYMQHSIKQMKHQQVQQGIFGVLGAVLGQVGGVTGALGRLGAGIGNGLLSLRYSRSDEAQADSVGAIIMYKADYNPVAMAQFFRKLEEQGGGNGPNFMSDHPNPGNRVASIEDEIKNWPSENYDTDNAAFLRIHQQAASVHAYTAQEIAQGAKNGTWAAQNRQSGATPQNLPAPSSAPPSASANQPLGAVPYAQVRPSGSFARVQTNLLSTVRPNNWQAYPADNNLGLTIAPPAGVAQGAVAYGALVNIVDNRNAPSIDQATSALVSQLQQSNPGLRATGNLSRIKVGGTDARSIEMTGTSPIQQNGRAESERDWLVTMSRPQGGLVYFVFIAPDKNFSNLRPTFRKILDNTQLR